MAREGLLKAAKIDGDDDRRPAGRSWSREAGSERVRRRVVSPVAAAFEPTDRLASPADARRTSSATSPWRQRESARRRRLAAGGRMCRPGDAGGQHRARRGAQRRRRSRRHRDVHAGRARDAGARRRAGAAGRGQGRAHPRRRQVRSARLHVGRQSLQPAGQAARRPQPQGPHAGDLPNLTVGADGKGRLESTTELWSTLLGGPHSVFDADSSALVIHAAPDDFRTDPTGNSGARIACGVIVKK